MITNERQYRITKAEAERFEHALMHGDEQSAHLHPRLRQAMREGLESQLMELRAQVAEYESLLTLSALSIPSPDTSES